MESRNRGPKVRSEGTYSGSSDLADRVRGIIETRNLSLRAVSQATEAMFGHGSPHFVPHNFYYELSLGSFSPSLHQLFALSRVSNYRFFDWLHVFGLDPEEIPRLQILLPSKRTIMLDSSLNDPNSWVSWFENRLDQTSVPAVSPLSQILRMGPRIRQRHLPGGNRWKFLYAKIGQEDAFAFPDLLPGSIVRIEPEFASAVHEKESRRLFLVEHSKGICCGRLLPGSGGKVTLISTQLPYAQVQFRIGHDVRILGAVDLEFRRAYRAEKAKVPSGLARRWHPELFADAVPKLTQYLQRARMKAGLSLRDASQLSREIAKLLDDERYFISASSLSDYEAGDALPKHFQKAVSLCLAYAAPFRTFLRASGIPEETAERDSIPDRFIPRLPANGDQENVLPVRFDGLIGELMRQVGDPPVFLRHAIDDLSGLTSTSLRTIFWVGGIKHPLHAYLKGALLVSVDRHKKIPIDSRSRPIWKHLFYLLLKRDGDYVLGPCGLENGAIVMHPDAEHLHLREEFRNHRDAEVVGQVCAILRKL